MRSPFMRRGAEMPRPHLVRLVSPNRLDEIASEICITWGRVERDIAATRRLLIEAKEECRRQGQSFDVWANSRELGIGRSQIYNLLDGRTSSHHIHPADAIFSPAQRGHLRSKNDDVPTHEMLARRIVDHFPITGRSLDPCRGPGAFYHALPEPKDWCEIKEGRDFLDWTEPVDWIATNPAWSAEAYRAIARHAYEIADNVVFLARWHTATATYARHRDWLDAGHAWRETVYIPWKDAGFLDKHGDGKSEGFILAAFWWQRGWTGGMTETILDVAQPGPAGSTAGKAQDRAQHPA
jgi:hypothetical protein